MDSLVSFGLTKMGDPCLGKPSKKKEKTFFTFKGGSRSVFVTLFKNMFKVKCFFSAITLTLKIGESSDLIGYIGLVIIIIVI